VSDAPAFFAQDDSTEEFRMSLSAIATQLTQGWLAGNGAWQAHEAHPRWQLHFRETFKWSFNRPFHPRTWNHMFLLARRERPKEIKMAEIKCDYPKGDVVRSPV
jgi:hypothetical protein